MMTLPIVRTACRTGQTAVASIPRHMLSGLLVPVCMFAVGASHGTHEACECARNLAPAFYERHDFASQPPRSVERLYYTCRGMSRKNSSMDDNSCSYLTRVRANVYYTNFLNSSSEVITDSYFQSRDCHRIIDECTGRCCGSRWWFSRSHAKLH
jgi:hypothetical protein